MTRDCGHGTGDDQRLRTRCRDDQRLRTRYRDDQRTADTVQEMTRDCGHVQG
ncbi:unnamed protein product [Staurois parvus]|uniref:Uncharacterized protein n=1 Tax=Staurois parvus TaxID=386267 RepID=A0ABN9B299_9NEOB|nr:unnamed protein product [Staurois parvus]